MNKLSIASLVSVFAVCSAQASLIAIDFNNTTAAAWTVNGSAGPLNNPNWNSTSTASGGPQALVDDVGAPTTATVTWTSSNDWTNGDGNGTEETKLAHAYLDDGAGGAFITVNNIPYAQYTVYGLIASGQNGAGGTYTTMDFQVNGTDWVIGSIIDGNPTAANNSGTAHGGIASSGGWVEILGDGAGSQTQTGNYWVWEGGTSATLTVDGQQRVGNSRGSITGLIIEEVIPEPGTLGLTLIGFGFLLVHRRRR